MVGTLEELASQLSSFDRTADSIFYENRLLENIDFSANSMASKRALERYNRSLQRSIVEPSNSYLSSNEFYSLGNKAKGEVVRGVVEPSVMDGYDLIGDTSRRFHNTLFDEQGVSYRAITPRMDLNRLEAVTANIIERTLDNEEIERGKSLLQRGYEQNMQNAHRGSVLETALQYAETNRVMAHRETRSSDPCSLCSRMDGEQVLVRAGGGAWRIGDGFPQFHDNCSCELVLYFN